MRSTRRRCGGEREVNELKAAGARRRDEERKAMSHSVRVAASTDKRRAGVGEGGEEEDKENVRLERLLRDASMPREGGERRQRALRELATGKARWSGGGWPTVEGGGERGAGEAEWDEWWTQRMLQQMMDEYEASLQPPPPRKP